MSKDTQETLSKNVPDSVLALAKLASDFALVHRVTFLADGSTPESDTDHTVMLGLIACAFAAAEEPSFDLGKIAQFALVHDLVEVYAGDTNTFGMLNDATAKADKKAREDAALKRIKEELGEELPWIPNMIEAYESLATPEARYIKSLDKIMPKISRILNNDSMRTNKEAFDAHCAHQLQIFTDGYGKDLPKVHELYLEMMERCGDVIAANDAATDSIAA